MAYKYRKANRSYIGSCDIVESETIEQKMERILHNGEPITDGAPEIYTERKDGVGAAYDIRTDRWELAAESMDIVQANLQAKRDAKAEKRKEAKENKEAKVVKLDKKVDGGAESTNGTSDTK
jgi:hypothetical protein